MSEDPHAFCKLGLEAQDKFIGEQNAKLRELLAEAKAKDYTDRTPAALCFGEVAERLRAILNNVTGVEQEI